MSGGRTRMALLAGRAQLSLARQGHRLLEEKRDALLRELYREVRVVHAAHEEMESAMSAARLALEEARVRLGAETVAAAAAAAMGEIRVDIEAVTVMGVSAPAITPRSLVRATRSRGRAVEASGPVLELVAERHEHALTVALRVATLETRVRRLAREVRRPSTRVNALQTRVIPDLERETRAIALALEQREREDRFRLKRVKSQRAARRASAAG